MGYLQPEQGFWWATVSHSPTENRLSEYFGQTTNAGEMQVAFHQFMDRNWGDIAAVYEDKHILWGCGGGGKLVRRSIPMRRARVS